MTNSTTAPATPPAGFLDGILLGLRDSAQSGSITGVGITLTIGGSVISGTLVGRNTWLDSMHNDLSTNHPTIGKVTEVLRDTFRHDLSGDEAELSKLMDDDLFIHLVDAKYVTGMNALPSEGSLFWRGRIDRVEGWSLGALG